MAYKIRLLIFLTLFTLFFLYCLPFFLIFFWRWFIVFTYLVTFVQLGHDSWSSWKYPRTDQIRNGNLRNDSSTTSKRYKWVWEVTNIFWWKLNCTLLRKRLENERFQYLVLTIHFVVLTGSEVHISICFSEAEKLNGAG